MRSEYIAEGSFGIIHKLISVESNQIQILKTVSRGSAERTLRQFESSLAWYAEAMHHQRLHHENIVELVDVSFSDNEMQLVMEYTEAGDSMRFLLKSKPLQCIGNYIVVGERRKFGSKQKLMCC